MNHRSSAIVAALVLICAVSCGRRTTPAPAAHRQPATTPGQPAAAAPADQPSTDARGAVEYLLSLRHGPRRTTERGRAIVKKIEENPSLYVEPIRDALEVPDDIETLGKWGDPAPTRLARALILAETLGWEQGGALVLPFLRDLDAAIEKLLQQVSKEAGDAAATTQRESSLRSAELLQIAALTVLTNLKVPMATEHVLRTLAVTDDNARRFAMLRYLQAVAIGDADVAAALRKLIEDQDSPLHNDPDALRLVELILDG